MDRNTLVPFFRHLEDKAESLRDAAGHNGEYHDRGASNLESQIEVYQAALKHEIPAVWEREYQMFLRKTDPEFAEYRRLAKKFGEGDLS